MRKYLFRGKRIDNGEWVHGNLWCTPCIEEDSWIALPIGDLGNTTTVEKVNPETVGQYTGMVDKNGTKIFEGDIIDFSDRSDGESYGVVQYDANETEFGFEYDNIYRSLGRNFYPENIEVVGNAYDNPELVNKD